MLKNFNIKTNGNGLLRKKNIQHTARIEIFVHFFL